MPSRRDVFILCLALTCLGSGFAVAEPGTPKRVLMVVNEGLWAPEYYEPRRVFDRLGFHVTVAGKYPGVVHPDRRNTNDAPIPIDVTFDKADPTGYDAVTFAGGNGAWTDYFPNEDVHRLVRRAFRQQKVIGLLCASTGLLGLVDNLDGKGRPPAVGRRVTGYFRVEGILRNLGRVQYDPGVKGQPHVVVDGRLVTGRDPESSALFGETVARQLQGMP